MCLSTMRPCTQIGMIASPVRFPRPCRRRGCSSGVGRDSWGAVVTLVVPGVGVSGGDLHVAQVHAGVEHGGDEGVSQHVRVHARQLHASFLGEVPQPAGGAVPVHPSASAGYQDRSGVPVVDGAVDGTADGGWEGYEHDLVALAVHAEHAVAVFLAEVCDVAAGSLEDPQPEQAEHGDQGEVARVGRASRCGEHSFELQVCQT
jgi:hypothetical protein